MTIYQSLRNAGYKESKQGPIVISGLAGIIETFEISRTQFAILPGCLVPEAKPEKYDLNTFNDNYIVFLKSDK